MAKQKAKRPEEKGRKQELSREELLARRKARRKRRQEKKRLRLQRRQETRALLENCRRKEPLKGYVLRLREEVPPARPNETIFCRYCETETSHTVSDYCGSIMRLCTQCGEMRHPRTDARPRPRQSTAA